jgi:RNA polymerase sigma-70 factor (ECF subfamily)
MATHSRTTSTEDHISAFVTAYALYKQKLSSYAFFKTHNPTLTEDLVQDTFIKTWAYLVKHGEVQSMKSFLYHVLTHLIIDEYRKSKPTSLDTLQDKGFDPPTHTHERLPEMWDGRKAAKLIEQLPPRYQTIVRMRFLQDLSIKEISELTGQSSNTVTVQSHRGLRRLRRLYLQQEGNTRSLLQT